MMKPALYLFLPVFVLGLFSCEDDPITPTGGTPPPVYQNTFFLKKNGVPFNPGYTEFGVTFENIIGIYASPDQTSNQNTYGFMFNDQLPVGEYDLATLYENGFWFTHTDEESSLYEVNSGMFKVIQHDTVNDVLELLFSMELENEQGTVHQITDGHFIANY